jgi:hypothetical protein
MSVVLDLRSLNGKIIARMKDGKFVLNRNNFLQVTRQKSYLKVTDEYGDEVLSINYINPTTISVETPVFAKFSVTNSCMANTMAFTMGHPEILINYDLAN